MEPSALSFEGTFKFVILVRDGVLEADAHADPVGQMLEFKGNLGGHLHWQGWVDQGESEILVFGLVLFGLTAFLAEHYPLGLGDVAELIGVPSLLHRDFGFRQVVQLLGASQERQRHLGQCHPNLLILLLEVTRDLLGFRPQRIAA